MIDFNDVHKWEQNQILEKYDFKKNIQVEFFDLNQKQEALNIIRNNDFLQYHYFSQDYKAVKAASYIYLFYLTYNDIKMYIGFASIASPTLAKKLRRKYFGKQFFETIYSESKIQNKSVKTYVLSRLVLLPSYRGLGLSTFILEKITKDMRNKSFYFEMLSNMFHTFYFGGYEFNTIFIKSKNILSKDEYENYFSGDSDITKSTKGLRGFKGETKFVANLVFDFKKDEFLKNIIKEKYNIEIDWNLKNEINRENFIWADNNEIPLILLEHSNIENIKQNKDIILKTEQEYLSRHKKELKNIDFTEGDNLW